MADRRGRILGNRGTIVLIEFGGYSEVYEVPHDQLGVFTSLAERYFERVRVLGPPRDGREQIEAIRSQMASR